MHEMRIETRFAGLFVATAFMAAATAAGQSIAISPSYTTTGVNGTVQYTATVTGLTNTAVTWSVNNVKGGNSTYGTISASGLYTAPAAIPSGGILIGALGSDKKTSTVVYVAVEPVGPTITSISPNPIPVGSYTVTITGSGFQKGAIAQSGGINLTTTFVNATTLKVAGYQGSAAASTFMIENTGTLFGPAFPGAVRVQQASSGADDFAQDGDRAVGCDQQFTSSGATGWTATAGTISAQGLYTAPAAMPTSSTVTVTATGAGGSASATVTLQAKNSQTISPTSVSLGLGATQQFTSPGATSWSAGARHSLPRPGFIPRRRRCPRPVPIP